MEIKFFLAPVLHRLMHNLVFFPLSFSINKSSAVLAQHLTWWGADSSGWQIRDPQQENSSVFPLFVVLACLAVVSLDDYQTHRHSSHNPVCLTDTGLNKSKGGGCHCSALLSSHRGEENVSTPVVWNCLDIAVVMWNISFCTLTNSKIPPPFD